MSQRAVIVTTKHRGVFFGYAADTTGDRVTLKNARCAIRFGTDGGFFELAASGPTPKSKIGSTAPEIDVRDITSVLEVSDDAEKAWLDA